MDSIYTNYLYSKHILVGQANDLAQLNYLYLATAYGIKVTKGSELLTIQNINDVMNKMGTYVVEPFYRNYPESVKQLTPMELLAGQLNHYAQTYGTGNFDGNANHSVFEKEFEKKLFAEKPAKMEFVCLTKQEASKKVEELVSNLLVSSRPLNSTDLSFVFENINIKYEGINSCCRCYEGDEGWIYFDDKDTKDNKQQGNIDIKVNCKDTTLRILFNLYSTYAGFNENKFSENKLVKCLLKQIEFNDVYKLIEIFGQDPKKLKFNKKQKAFIKFLMVNKINTLNDKGIKLLFEKRQNWKGLIHNLHYYHPKLECLFDSKQKNISANAEFEKVLVTSPVKASQLLIDKKGNGALLRHLNYVLSRCKTTRQVESILNKLESKNTIVLIQLLIEYGHYNFNKEARYFNFIKNKLLVNHKETNNEVNSRKSILKNKWVETIVNKLETKLDAMLANQIDSVYVDKDMDNVAIPLAMADGNGGINVLPKGSIVNLPKAKVFRLFTYWEKVNDIDLSCQCINSDGTIEEFSWRTFYSKQSDEICFSGDETNGYNGGSEYIDIDVEAFKAKHPKAQYFICCDNVFSGTGFNNCICKAGYMVREKLGSGEIFEPRTVKTSFAITGKTNFNVMFALDLINNKLIWLNANMDRQSIIANNSNLKALIKYFDITNKFSVAKVITKCAKKVVKGAKDAQIIVSDKQYELLKGQEQIHSWDFEKLLKYINKK